MNYIGSKYTLMDFLHETIGAVSGYKDGDKYIFADLFAGTGVVGAYYKSLGCEVISNDIQYYSYVLNKHYIENNKNNVNIDLIDYFNNLKGVEGFIYNNFCVGSGSNRNYFTDNNGKKCDAIRIELERLFRDRTINEHSYYFYLGSLINSIDKYANTASVYGAFLKGIKKAAQKDFILEPLDIINGPLGKVYNNNINDIINKIKGDILYLDPPYNARQYCSNYHVLETIAKYDNPQLFGITGLRESEDQKSEYCSKKTVEKAFEYIIANAKFKYIFLSYNNEGLMSLETIKKIMEKYGDYSVFTKIYKRFKADKDENRNTGGNETIEYIHCLRKKNYGKI